MANYKTQVVTYVQRKYLKRNGISLIKDKGKACMMNATLSSCQVETLKHINDARSLKCILDI